MLKTSAARRRVPLCVMLGALIGCIAFFAVNTAAFAAHFGITPHSVYNANRRSDDLSAMLRGIVIAYELGREKKS